MLTISDVSTMENSLIGFTIQHGLATSSSDTGAGVVLAEAGAVLSGNLFLDNSGNNIAVFYGTVSVLNSSFSTAPTDFGSGCDGGSAVFAYGSSPVYDTAGLTVPFTVTGNTISGDSTRCSGTAIDLTTTNFTAPHLIADNIIRNSALGLNLAVDEVVGGGTILRQNLIYDNANGAVVVTSPTGHPSTDPAVVLFVNNTIVNNLNAPAASPLTEIDLAGSVARVAFVNNILVGTTGHPVLTCDAGSPTYNDTPLILDHTDIYNTTQSAGGLVVGDCATGISGQLSSNGNLSADPRFNSSTDLHVAAGSPALDIGTNSAPSLTTTDLDGNPRVLDATGAGTNTVDLGAYESAGAGDSGVAAVALSSSSYDTAPTTITLSAISTAPDGTHPAGTITFAENGATLSAVHTDSSGAATLQVPLTATGIVRFTAALAPDAAYAPTISPVLYVNVTAGSIAATSTLTLAVSPSTITTAQSTTVTVQLGTTHDGGVIPSGAVLLTDNGASIATLHPGGTTGIATQVLANLAAGTHTLAATYTGNTGFTTATAGTAVTVNALLPSTLTLNASSTTELVGQPVTLTLHLGSLTAGNGVGPTPPGAVTLYNGTTLLTTLQPDSLGNAIYTIPSPASGTVIYKASYAGNTVYSASNASSTIALTAPASTVTAVSANPSPAIFGAAVTFSATVANTAVPATAPTGSITFTDGPVLLGTAPLIGTAASLTINSLSLGPHTITATFVPSTSLSSPSHAAVTITVPGTPTTTILTSARNPGLTTDLVAYTVIVSPAARGASPAAAPPGVVAITDGFTLLASGALTPASANSSTVTLTLADPNVGSRTLTATYTPSSANFISSTGTWVESLSAAPVPSVTLAASPNPASVIDSIHLAISLTNVPSGSTLNLLDGATALPVTSSAGPTGSSSAANTIAPDTLAVGTHTLSAVLRDPHGVLLATSTPVAERILGLSSTLALNVSPALSVSVGAPVTLTAALTSATPTGHTPTGSVTFRDGGAVLGSVPLDATGHAALPISTLSVGSHALTAIWSGDDLLSAATSAVFTEQILLNPTTTSLAVSPMGPSSAFQAVTLLAQVTAPTSLALDTAVCNPACAPTAITFFADTVAGHAALGTVSVDSAGRATLLVHPEAGAIAFSAAFSGSPLFSPSTSSAIADTVLDAPSSLSLTGSPNPLYEHGAVTLTATLTSPVSVPASALAQGSITVLEGTTVLGAIAAPSGTLAYTPSTPGTHTLKAIFAGTADLAPATTTLVVTVLASDFSVSVKDTALTIPTEHHAPTTVTVTASGAFSDTVDLSCDNPPALVTCTFTPAIMAVSADGSQAGPSSVNVQLVVDTDFIQNWADARHGPLQPGSNSSATQAYLLPADTSSSDRSSSATLSAAQMHGPDTTETIAHIHAHRSRATSHRGAIGSIASAVPALGTVLALSLPTTFLFTRRRPKHPRTPQPAATGWLSRISHLRHGPQTLSGVGTCKLSRSPNLLAALLLSAVALGISACSGLQPGHTPPGSYLLTITAHARDHSYTHTATINLTVAP